jgi:hypothetical protein
LTSPPKVAKSPVRRRWRRRPKPPRPMAEESWKPWPGDPRYLVSDQGRVRGPSGKIMKLQMDPKGRWRAGYTKDGKTKKPQVHQMVLEAFVGPCPPGHETRHRNGTPTDNRLENLVYGTR